MKSLKVLLAAGVLMLGGCGGGSVQSPDFTSELVSIEIGDAPATAPIGRNVQLVTEGQFSAPPGSDPDTITRNVKASYTVSPASRATVSDTGIFIGKTVGNVTITAKSGGKTSAPITIEIIAPVLESLVITPETATIGVGSTRNFSVKGLFSDSETPRTLDTPITWESDDTSTVTVSPSSGPTTVATGVALGDTTITATTVSDEGETISDTAAITVTNATLTSLLRIEPVNAFVVQGFTLQFTAIGSFSDGSEQPLMGSSIDWDSATQAVATIDVNGLASGLTTGQSVITATLKPEVVASGGRTATVTLTVTDSVCTAPFLLSAGASITGDVNGLCVLCKVDDPAFVIDADPETAAVLRVPVAALGGSASLTATASDGTTFPAGMPAGFIVRRPAGGLISAELLTQLSLATLNNGVEVENSTDGIPLRVTLLGLFGDDEAALLSFVPTQPFDALRLKSGGVLSALATTEVSSACAVAAPPAP
ncbi:MAG: Ig-like domain-containing protein [Panacagrimonas sp.]